MPEEVSRVVWMFVIGLLAGALLTGFGMQLVFVQRLTALEVTLQANTEDHGRLLRGEEAAQLRLSRQIESIESQIRALWERRGQPLP